MIISFACNNVDNGSFQGWFDSAWVGGEALIEGPRTTIRSLSDNRVRIGRLTYSHNGWNEWVGNWCWDEIEIFDTLRLLEYLRHRRWQCVEGPSAFFQKWEQGHPVTLASFEHAQPATPAAEPEETL